MYIYTYILINNQILLYSLYKMEKIEKKLCLIIHIYTEKTKTYDRKRR